MSRESEHHEREVERLTSKTAQLRKDLAEAEQQLRGHRIALAPFKVGDVVRAKGWGNKPMEDAIVRRVRPSYSGFDFDVSYRRKNGEWMEREQRASSVEAGSS